MISLVFLYFVDLFVTVFNAILLVRVIMSYFASPENGFFAWLVNITEPVLAPVRKMVPAMSGIDLASLVTFFLLQALQYGAHVLVSGI